VRHLEDQHQEALLAWCNLQPQLVGRIWSTPNGGKRNLREAARLKRMGTLAGVADIFVAIPTKAFSGLFIELKAPLPHAARVTKHQAAFLQRMNESGYLAVVCYGWDVARDRIIDYLK